jgi:hypothetical protein
VFRSGDFQKKYWVRIAGLMLAIQPECSGLEIAAQIELQTVAHPPRA